MGLGVIAEFLTETTFPANRQLSIGMRATADQVLELTESTLDVGIQVISEAL